MKQMKDPSFAYTQRMIKYCSLNPSGRTQQIPNVGEFAHYLSMRSTMLEHSKTPDRHLMRTVIQAYQSQKMMDDSIDFFRN